MDLTIPWTTVGSGANEVPTRGSRILTADDADLVGRARAGDQVAFTQLFEQYHAPILNYLHRMVGDRAQAEDLTQDTFLKAYNALPGTRPDLAFKPWLYRIATNTAISQLRRRKIVQWIPFMPGHDHAGGEAVERTVTRRQDIQQTLEKLPSHYAAVLLLRHYQGLSLAETAQALGVTENAAKLRLFRARKAFAEVYEVANAVEGEVGRGSKREQEGQS
jgi:RNA polymerase sigma-70 factor (ECF subfamily)